MLKSSDKLDKWQAEGFISRYKWEVVSDVNTYGEESWYEQVTIYFPNGKQITFQGKDPLDFW